MAPINHPGSILPQDLNFDNADQPGTELPLSQSEIDELEFGDDRPVAERLARLRELRGNMATREAGDWGDQDPKAMIAEIDRVIETLSTGEANADDADDYAGLAPTLDSDPLDRRELLSPDDDLLAGEDKDEEGLDVLDEEEWDDGDDFKPEHGVH
ncbi:MAG: hypothetical protein ABI414_09450 [Devosia sp.]